MVSTINCDSKLNFTRLTLFYVEVHAYFHFSIIFLACSVVYKAVQLGKRSSRLVDTCKIYLQLLMSSSRIYERYKMFTQG